MATHEMMQNVQVNRMFFPIARIASATSVSVDTQGFESFFMIINVGTFVDGQFQITVQASDDNTSWVAVPESDLISAEGSNPFLLAATKVFTASYIGFSRYVRLQLTEFGSPVTGITMGAEGVLGVSRHAPTLLTPIQ